MIPAGVVQETIDNFTKLDAAGDQRSMNKMARRLGKEQPALLQFAARQKEERSDDIGEAAVFYGTLVWAIFDRNQSGSLPRLTPLNIEAAEEIASAEQGKIEGLSELPIHERVAPPLVERQPNIYAKLQELVDEDVREKAMTEECAEVIFPATQVIVEAFDAALEGRRPGEHLGPIVRETPKVGRNEPCPCGSGKKYKKCCGKA